MWQRGRVHLQMYVKYLRETPLCRSFILYNLMCKSFYFFLQHNIWLQLIWAPHTSGSSLCFKITQKACSVCFSQSEGNRGGNEPLLQTLLPRSFCCDPAQTTLGCRTVWSNGEWDGWDILLSPLWLVKTTPLRRWKRIIWQEIELNEIKIFTILKRVCDLCRADLMILVCDVWAKVKGTENKVCKIFCVWIYWFVLSQLGFVISLFENLVEVLSGDICKLCHFTDCDAWCWHCHCFLLLTFQWTGLLALYVIGAKALCAPDSPCWCRSWCRSPSSCIYQN